MRFLTIIFLIKLVAFQVQGQHHIKEEKFNLICGESSYELVVPQLDSLSLEASELSEMNDSILGIFNFWKSQVVPCIVEIDEEGEGDEYGNEIEYEVRLNYKVLRNSKNIISIVINQSTAAVGRGHGSESTPICFNVDLQNNRQVLLEDLMTKTSIKALASFIHQNLDSLSATHELSFLPEGVDNTFNKKWGEGVYSVFKGIGVSDTHVNFYYQYYMGHGISDADYFQMSFLELKPYLKSYWNFLNK